MTASKKSKPLTDMLWDKIYTDSYSSLIFLLNLFANFLFRAIKKAECWRTDAFELWCWTLESPLDCKEIQLVNPKGKQSWIFIGRTDAEAETPILWPPAAKNWLIWKDPDAGKDWGQEEKGTTEDEMVGWHHQHNGHEFGWTLGVGDGQGGLVCCSSWGRKELDTTEQLNWTISLYFYITYLVVYILLMNILITYVLLI